MSELSDALNPYITRTNSYYSQQSQHHYAPHRSELELAVRPPQRRGQPSAEGIQAVQELIRVVSATRDAHEAEKKRRIAWENDQEAKQTVFQSETTRQLHELRQEISRLQALVGDASPISPISQNSSLPSKRRRRSSDSDQASTDSETSDNVRRPVKRRNNHDKRCLTIHVSLHITCLFQCQLLQACHAAPFTSAHGHHQ